MAGEVELIVDDRSFHLREGDSFAFQSERPHHYRNMGSRRASIFWVNTRPRSDHGKGPGTGRGAEPDAARASRNAHERCRRA